MVTPVPGPGPGAGPGPVPEHDLLVLAGGEGERMGGVSKADVVLAGRSMLDRVLDAAPGARRVVVVGPAPAEPRAGVATALEDPPLGGPVAGIDAGLTALGRDGDVPVVVLACDAPLAAGAVPVLLAALTAARDADLAHLVDADGHAQRLVAAYRRAPLRTALAGLAGGDGVHGVHGVSVRRMVAGMTAVAVPDPDGLGRDVDTWQALEELAALLPPAGPDGGEG